MANEWYIRVSFATREGEWARNMLPPSSSSFSLPLRRAARQPSIVVGNERHGIGIWPAKGEVFKGYSFALCQGASFVSCCPLSHLTPRSNAHPLILTERLDQSTFTVHSGNVRSQYLFHEGITLFSLSLSRLCSRLNHRVQSDDACC